MTNDLVISDDVTIPARDLSWSAVRAAGPGGQNVNKVATKVELRFDLEKTHALSEPVKARLRRQAARFLTAEGRLVVSCQQTRSQLQNLRHAERQLVALIQRALREPRRRRLTRPSRAAIERRLKGKRHLAARKRQRRPAGDED